MRAASRSKPVRKAPKVHLVDLVEDGHHGLLDDLIFQRCDAQRTLPSVFLLDVHSPRGLRSVRSPVNPVLQIDQPTLQTFFILLPPHAVHSRRRVPLERVVALPQQIEGQMVQKGGEPFLLPFPRHLAHTRQTLGHAAPVLCRWRATLAGVLLGSRPSLHRLLRGLRPLVRRLHRYCDAIRLLSGVHVRRAALGLPGPVPRGEHRRGLPVLVHAVAQRAWGLRLRGITRRLALSVGACVAFPLRKQGRHPDLWFSQLDTLPTDTSVYASTAASRLPPQDSRPGGSLLLSCKTLSFSTACRFIPALCQRTTDNGPIGPSRGGSHRWRRLPVSQQLRAGSIFATSPRLPVLPASSRGRRG